MSPDRAGAYGIGLVIWRLAFARLVQVEGHTEGAKCEQQGRTGVRYLAF